MDTYCPDCNTKLTKSIVGHLCSGCGAVHGFEKMASVAATAQQATSKASKGNKHHVSDKKVVAHTIKSTPGQTRSKFHHSVKKFMVPEIAELPKPIDESHLLEPKTHAQTVPRVQATATASFPEIRSETHQPAITPDFSDEDTTAPAIEDRAGDSTTNLVATIVLIVALILVAILLFLLFT